MNKVASKFDRLLAVILPIAFIGPGFLNMYAYVLDGHKHEWFRQLFVLGIQAGVAVLLFVKVCQIFITRKEARRPILLVLCIPVAFLLVSLWAILLSADGKSLLTDIVKNGCYLACMCCAIVVIVAGKIYREFLNMCRNYALAVSPIVLYYCIRFYLPSAAYGVQNLGVLVYMPLAYCLMEFCIFFVLRVILLEKEGEKRSLPWLDYVLYTLFAIAITLSGTKGTIVCLIWAGLLGLCYGAIARKNVRIFGCYCLIAILAVGLFCTVLAPSYGVENRVVTFIKELFVPGSSNMTMQDVHQSADIINKVEKPTTEPPVTEPPVTEPPVTEPPVTEPPVTEPPVTEPPITEPPVTQPPATEPLVTEPADMPLLEDVDISEFVVSGKAKEALKSGQITQEEYDSIIAMYRKVTNTAMGGRKILWVKALSELKVAPLTGQGAMFYQGKYGTYPHNFFLELGTDFGIPVMILIAALGLFVFIRLAILSFKDPLVAAFTFYVFAYLPRMAVGGSPYHYYYFFQYGLSVVLLFLIWKKSKAGKKVNKEK